jgi:dihydrolipoamide dehydrogenase
MDLSNRRGVQLVQGKAVFEGSDRVRLSGAEISHIKFKNAILATGSYPTPFRDTAFNKESRVMDSASALELTDIPESLLIIGGGYIALELGTVYASLGSRVTVVVRSERLLRGADPDLVKPLLLRLNEIFEAIHFNTVVASLKENRDHVSVKFEGEIDQNEQNFDRVLIAIGRKPNSANIGLETTQVKVDEKGFVQVDEHQRTADERIFAVGDVAGGMLLAHKASREGKVAAEVIAGEPSAFDVRAIPAVVYTDPQVAWCGLTEQQAEKEQRSVTIERFPWKFSGRAMTMGAADGLTKILVEPKTGRILGVGISGRDSEGMISEGVLAVEMGALAEDVALSVHPHPTLSETEAEVAEIFMGSAIHVPPEKKQK